MMQNSMSVLSIILLKYYSGHTLNQHMSLPGEPTPYRLNIDPEVHAEIVRKRKQSEDRQVRPRLGFRELDLGKPLRMSLANIPRLGIFGETYFVAVAELAISAVAYFVRVNQVALVSTIQPIPRVLPTGRALRSPEAG